MSRAHPLKNLLCPPLNSKYASLPPAKASMATPSGVVTTSSSSGPIVQDVNSIEYRMMILEKVQQWNEHKKKIVQRNAKPRRSSSPLLDTRDETFDNPSNDGACPVQPFSCSVNINPCSNTSLVGSLTETAGLNSLILSASSLTTSKSHTSVTSEASAANATVSAQLSALSSPKPLPAFGSPKLLTVGPPVTFAEILNINLCSNTSLVGNLTETPGLNSLILSASSLTTSNSHTSVTSEASAANATVSAPLSALSSSKPLPAFDSPSLLTAGPPVTFAETLLPNSSPSLSSSHSGKDLMSMTSPTGLSVAGDATEVDDITTASYGSSIVSPGNAFNSESVDDISAMSHWELEQLYRHNMEKLEQQKKFISILEAQLKQIHEQLHTTNQKPSQSDVYKHFLSFVVEPELVPDVPIVSSNKFGYGHLLKQSSGAKAAPPLDFNEVVKGGTFDRPVMNEKYDFYANFSRS